VKICFVCNEYPPGLYGGVGVVTRVMARALVAAGHPVRVIGMYQAARMGKQREMDEGVEVHRIEVPAGPLGWARGRYAVFQRVREWAEQGEISLVEVPDVAGMAAHWPALPVPVVTRLHGSLTYFQAEEGKTAPWSLRHLEGAGLRRADGIASTSRYTADRTQELFGLRGAAAQAVEVLYNVIDAPPEFHAGPRAARRVVYSGTLAKKKGVIQLAQAWAAVRARVPDAELHLYGKDGSHEGGSMQAHLESLAGPESGVTFHSHVQRPELIEALKTATCAVFPSFAEAFALAPLEAMAFGCPTIGSRMHSGPELITHGVDGLLVDPNHPSAISEAILDLLLHQDRASAMAEAGWRSVSRRFALDALLPRNTDFYRRVTAGFAVSASAAGVINAESGN
jgi:glycosyltransferase involved in cell wall biosynthesis